MERLFSATNEFEDRLPLLSCALEKAAKTESMLKEDHPHKGGGHESEHPENF